MTAKHLHGQIRDLVEHLIDVIPPGQTFADWLDDSEKFDAFDDLEVRESVAYAYGYLLGVADACGVTVIQLIEEHRRDP